MRFDKKYGVIRETEFDDDNEYFELRKFYSTRLIVENCPKWLRGQICSVLNVYP